MATHGRVAFALVALGLLPLLCLGCGHHRRASSSVATGAEERPTAAWYFHDWMATSPYAPSFRVLDTESSLGPYAEKTKTITLKDLVKMHGHPCDGLFTAACALSVGLGKLFSDGVVDRTDLCCITNDSPCYGDVAAYLTGGRVRFGTQKIDPSLKHVWILHRPSLGRTLRVRLRDGVFPEELASLEGRIKSGDYEMSDVRRCQKMQWDFARGLLQEPLATWFEVDELPGYVWKPDAYEHLGQRGDVKLKNVFEAK